MDPICYRKLPKYKYQLYEDYSLEIEVKVKIETQFIELMESGELLLLKGYAWDGPSGPTIDSNNFMRASLVHDALYQLIREGELDSIKYKPVADNIMRKLCLEDGMSPFRAFYTYWAVRLFGGSSVKPHVKGIKTYKAPK